MGADGRRDVDGVGFDLRQHRVEISIHRGNTKCFGLGLRFFDQRIANGDDLAIGHLLPAGQVKPANGSSAGKRDAQ